MKCRFLILILFSPLITFAKDNAMFFQLVHGLAIAGKEFRIEIKLRYENNAPEFRIAPIIALLNANNNAVGTLIDTKQYYVTPPKASKEWLSINYRDHVKQKNFDHISVGFVFKGQGRVSITSYKLFVYENGREKEIPLQNGDFAKETIEPWKINNLREGSLVQIQRDETSEKRVLLIDNTHVKEVFVAPGQLGNNATAGKYVNVNGAKLYYESYGERKIPILLLHGNNGHMTDFSSQINDFVQQYRVIGLDSRGQGKSTMDSTRLTYELMAEDVNTFLDSLHLKKVNILGWSDGGNIAVALVLKYPDKINKMAIMGTVLFNNSRSVRFWVNPLMRTQLWIARLKGMKKDNIYYRMKNLLLTEPHIDPERLKNIQVPVLVMAGERDVVREKHTRLIAEKMPNSQLNFFENAGHEAPWQVPQEFNKAVLDFFDRK